MNIDQSICQLYLQNPAGLHSINSIAKALGKTYPIIYKHTTKLITDQILKKIVVGKSHLCTLNYVNANTSILLSQTELAALNKEKETNSALSLLHNFFLTTYFEGLHSCLFMEKTNQLVFFISEKKYEKSIRNQLKKTTLTSNLLFIDQNDFSSHITKDKNFLKRKHFVLFGGEAFHLLLRANLKIIQQQYGFFENE